MTIPISILSGHPRREPVMVLPAAPQAPKQAERMHEAVPLEREKKRLRPRLSKRMPCWLKSTGVFN